MQEGREERNQKKKEIAGHGGRSSVIAMVMERTPFLGGREGKKEEEEEETKLGGLHP